MNITEHSLTERHLDRRVALFRSLTEALGDDLSAEELDIHFTHMPARYWQRATVASVRRQLELIHEFFVQLDSSDHAGTACIVRWQAVPKRGCTVVEVCTWDRLGLLAKVAGAFAAVGLNIVRADVFTRADNVALDVFQIAAPAGRPVQLEARLRQMAAVLAVALKPGGELPAHRAGPRPPGAVTAEFASSLDDNYTRLMVEAPDRVGLLAAIFTTLTANQINIAHAIITTEHGRAGDVFYLTDSEGHELRDPARLEQIRGLIMAALA